MTDASLHARHPLLTFHQLRTWPTYFRKVAEGSKTFEIRRNDRGYAVGDILELFEFEPPTIAGEIGAYTGRMVRRRVTYLTGWAQRPGHVVMGLAPFLEVPPEGARVKWPASGEPEHVWIVLAAGDEVACVAYADGQGHWVEEDAPTSELRILGAEYSVLYATPPPDHSDDPAIQGLVAQVEELRQFAANVAAMVASPGAEDLCVAAMLQAEGDDLTQALEDLEQHLAGVIEPPTGLAGVTDEEEAEIRRQLQGDNVGRPFIPEGHVDVPRPPTPAEAWESVLATIPEGYAQPPPVPLTEKELRRRVKEAALPSLLVADDLGAIVADPDPDEEAGAPEPGPLVHLLTRTGERVALGPDISPADRERLERALANGGPTYIGRNLLREIVAGNVADWTNLRPHENRPLALALGLATWEVEDGPNGGGVFVWGGRWDGGANMTDDDLQALRRAVVLQLLRDGVRTITPSIRSLFAFTAEELS